MKSAGVISPCRFVFSCSTALYLAQHGLEFIEKSKRRITVFATSSNLFACLDTDNVNSATFVKEIRADKRRLPNAWGDAGVFAFRVAVL